jgi:hypothetical protein
MKQQKHKPVYLDAEFIQFKDGDKVRIDMISIGLVNAQGKKYYAVSNEFNRTAAEANDFVRDTVLAKLPPEKSWKPLKQIGDEVLKFLGTEPFQINYWVIAQDVVLFEHLLSDSVLGMPKNMARSSRNLGLVWEDAGCPQILPPVDTVREHTAIYDAEWLRQVDRVLRGP